MHDSAHILPTASDFGRLFEQYKSSFVFIARSYVRDSMVAEDIVTDCFMKFWENRDKIVISQNIPVYILTSIKNRCLNWLRDENARLKVQQNIHSSTLRVMTQRISTLETNDPDSVFAKEIAAIIDKELGRMPVKMRDVFMASRLEDMTYKEIAKKLGLSVNQVDFEIRKATKILQSALKDYLTVLFIIFLAADIQL